MKWAQIFLIVVSTCVSTGIPTLPNLSPFNPKSDDNESGDQTNRTTKYFYQTKQPDDRCFSSLLSSNLEEEDLIDGFSPVVSWNTLSMRSETFDFIQEIKNKLPTSTLDALPVLKDSLTKTPETPAQCQLACILSPKCNSFTFLRDVVQNGSSESFPQGCYLSHSFHSSADLPPPTDASLIITGPRLCPCMIS